jgi:hypothetical protein
MTNLLEIKEALKSYDYSNLESELDLMALECVCEDHDEIDLDEFREQAQDYIMESVQVIYYATAIEFLAKEDPSLRESLEIADEYGTPLASINSEFLASILLQDRCSEELSQLIDELQGV